MAFKLSTPARVLEKELRDSQRKTQKASIRALNKTATQARNIAQRQIRETINVKAARIKKALSIKKANKSKLSVEIRASYQPIPVIYYNGVRQTKKGVSVRMRKDKGRHTFKGAFIATMPSGHKGVFRRKHRNSRLPIKELKGPSAHAIFGERLDDIVNKVNPILERIYNHEIDFVFGRVGRK